MIGRFFCQCCERSHELTSRQLAAIVASDPREIARLLQAQSVRVVNGTALSVAPPLALRFEQGEDGSILVVRE